jgi:cyclophilin family peptidyl-prolyl cis-trans isomerase
MTRIFTLILLLFSLSSFAAKPKNQYVRIKTDLGECIIKLYNETPLHRDNFVKLAKKHELDGTLFHRVIKDFMIQGGDPDSRTAKPDSALGETSIGPDIPAEFRDSLFHKKGALGAARDDKPEKSSSGSQFYLVQGKVFTDEQLDAVETNRLKAKIPTWQREVYKTIGGTPHLDRNYTVYGEIVKGLDLVDKVAAVATGTADRPVSDVRMTISLLKKREARRLERELKKAQQ